MSISRTCCQNRGSRITSMANSGAMQNVGPATVKSSATNIVMFQRDTMPPEAIESGFFSADAQSAPDIHVDEHCMVHSAMRCGPFETICAAHAFADAASHYGYCSSEPFQLNDGFYLKVY